MKKEIINDFSEAWDKEIDIWPGEITKIMKSLRSKYVYFLNEDILYERKES